MESAARYPRYVIVSPVKDEARYIDLTLRSVTHQTLKPLSWVIVDDGSSDATVETVGRYVSQYPFIHLVTTPSAGPRQTGSAEALAFKRGCATLPEEPYDFIVKLDGDLSFEADYFEVLLKRMVGDTRLGIASGVYLERDKCGSWVTAKMPAYHAFGACKVLRRACFEEIEGFLTTPGWDTVDEIRAWSRGWRTTHFADLKVMHHKREGTAMGLLATSVMHGEICYLTGYDPLLFVFKAVRRMKARPYIGGGVALVAGYVSALTRRKARLVTKSELRHYRAVLRRRLFGGRGTRTSTEAVRFGQ